MKILDFLNIRQNYDYDCGAKALQGVLAYYKIDIREDELIKELGTTKAGTPVTGILKVIERYGLKSKAGEFTVNEIKKYIDKKIPTIVPLQAWAEKKHMKWAENWKDGHYAVVIGYGAKKIYFADPGSIYITYLTEKEFEERWHDEDEKGEKLIHYGIAVYGKKRQGNKKIVHMN